MLFTCLSVNKCPWYSHFSLWHIPGFPECLCVNNSRILCPGGPHMLVGVQHHCAAANNPFLCPRECQSSYSAAFAQMLWRPTAICGCCEGLVSCILSVYSCIKQRLSQYFNYRTLQCSIHMLNFQCKHIVASLVSRKYRDASACTWGGVRKHEEKGEAWNLVDICRKGVGTCL